ncbi:uncharacterized protein TNCV_2750861 [Trichonephila clavipes]|nr:uncharacterized protein TNCV_2750861 [Trichonephila clavipes]
MLTSMSLGMGSNSGGDMDVYKCIVPLWHGGTLNSCQAASPLVRLVAGEERGRPLITPRVFSPQNWGGTEPNCTVTRMVLKAMAKDRCICSSLPQ